MINSVGLYNLSQNTVASVSVQTGLKAVGRPCAILLDKDIDAKTKKYSAMKEFLYQLACFGLYLAVVPIFKQGAYKLAQKIYKDEPILKLFDSPKSFKKFYELNPEEKHKKLAELINTKKMDINAKDTTPDNENLTKGVVEAGSLIGSVVGLAIIAPIASHPMIHPVLKMLGLNDKSNSKPLDKQA